MLERLLSPKHRKVHGRQLEQGSVPVRYGLIKFRDEYRRAAREHFPHAKNFVLGGCMLGAPREQEVMFCRECRAAESRCHDENPDFDNPSIVHGAITSARRDLPDSLAKRIFETESIGETGEGISSCGLSIDSASTNASRTTLRGGRTTSRMGIPIPKATRAYQTWPML